MIFFHKSELFGMSVIILIQTIQRMMSAKRHLQNSKKNPTLWVLITEAILLELLWICDRESKSVIDQDVSCSPSSSVK